MNWTLWLGTFAAVGLMSWSLTNSGSSISFFNQHGMVIVFGGTVVATVINCPFRVLFNAAGNFFMLFLPSRLPSLDAIVSEMTRLARRAQTEGGILSLQGESRDFAGGFLNRAVKVAISAGESNETRRILEAEVRQLRVQRQEDSNVFRTMGTLGPMFGLLGTLLGMIRVLETLSTPTKVGPAMAMSLSSAFLGIAFSNLVCIPLAGQIRLRAMQETMVLEMILEGVLDIMAGKPPALVELHLVSYSQDLQSRAGQQAASAPGTP